ncbi:MAG: ATP-binding protein [Chloroflexi bacterium]|nr:ATP-binding protein [Chloroflexota bacterium]
MATESATSSLQPDSACLAFYRRLNAAAVALSAPFEEPEVGQTAARVAAALLGADWGALFLPDERGALTLAALHPEGASPAERGRLLAEPVVAAARSRQVEPAGAESPTLAACLLRGGDLLGVLGVGLNNGRKFGHFEELLLPLVAAQVALALENARLRLRERELQQEKSDFVSLVSHEFKTPLTSIKGYAQLVGRRLGGEADRNVRRFLLTIDDQAERLAQLASAMVLYTRLESGQIPFRRQPIDLVGALAAAVDHAGEKVGGRGFVRQVQVPSLLVDVDPECGRLALVNLLSVAARRTPEGGNVEVGLRQEGESALVWVHDQGAVLSPEQRHQLMGRLYQREGAAGPLEGEALDFAIAKAIVFGHGGRLWLEGEPGAGNTVYFTLPQPRPGS